MSNVFLEPGNLIFFKTKRVLQVYFMLYPFEKNIFFVHLNIFLFFQFCPIYMDKKEEIQKKFTQTLCPQILNVLKILQKKFLFQKLKLLSKNLKSFQNQRTIKVCKNYFLILTLFLFKKFFLDFSNNSSLSDVKLFQIATISTTEPSVNIILTLEVFEKNNHIKLKNKNIYFYIFSTIITMNWDLDPSGLKIIKR